MLQRFQRLGGALFTPVLLFSFAGLIVGLGTLFTTQQVMGPIAAEGTLWSKVWRVLLAGGWTAFN
jgi:PTS system arbutin-like IIC component